MEENKLYCSHCGAIIEDENYSTIGEDIICPDCVERYCCTCEDCGELMYDNDCYGVNTTACAAAATRKIT